MKHQLAQYIQLKVYRDCRQHHLQVIIIHRVKLEENHLSHRLQFQVCISVFKSFFVTATNINLTSICISNKKVYLFLDKKGDKEVDSLSSASSKSPLTSEVINIDQDIGSSSSGAGKAMMYKYSANTNDGEMKRFFFNDLVAQAAVANAG